MNQSPLKPQPRKILKQTPQTKQANNKSQHQHVQSQYLNLTNNHSLLQTPDKQPSVNRSRSPFTNIQNQNTKNKFIQKQNDQTSPFDDYEEHSPMRQEKGIKHLTFLNDHQQHNNSQEYIARISELELALRKANMQRSVQEREIGDLRNLNIQLNQKLQETYSESALLTNQIKDAGRNGYAKHNEEVGKLHQLLKEKNNVILQWTNRYVALEKKYEQDIKNINEQHDKLFQDQVDKRIENEKEEFQHAIDQKDEKIEILINQLQDAEFSIIQTQKSFEVRTQQQEKELINQLKQNETLQQILSQSKDHNTQLEKDRNQWIEKYEGIMIQRYSRTDENKEKPIELRIMNQMLEQKCKELKEEKDKLNQTQHDLQQTLFQQKASNPNLQYERLEHDKTILERTIKEKDHMLTQIQNEYNNLLQEIAKVRKEAQDFKNKVQQEQDVNKSINSSNLLELKQNLENAQNKINQYEYKQQELSEMVSELSEDNEILKQEVSTKRSKGSDSLQTILIEKQSLEQQLNIQRQRSNELEFKVKQLENENEKLNQIRLDKSREIEQWAKKTENMQNECSSRLEELTHQFENLRNSSSRNDSQPLLDKIVYLESQLSMTKREVDLWKQRAQTAEQEQNQKVQQSERRNLDIANHYESEVSRMKSEMEDLVFRLKSALDEKMMELEEQNSLNEQLQRENFNLKNNLDRKTDQLLKLNLALQQAATMNEFQYLDEGDGDVRSREFSFQDDEVKQNQAKMKTAQEQQENEPLEEEDDDQNIFIERRQQGTLQSDDEDPPQNFRRKFDSS